MTKLQQLRLEMAINTAIHWGEWMKTERKEIDKKIFDEENFHSKMAIEAGSKSVIANVAIEKIDDILKLLKEIQDEQTN